MMKTDINWYAVNAIIFLHFSLMTSLQGRSEFDYSRVI